MVYKTVHGEIGYDITRDGHIFSIGYGSRAAARQAIIEYEKWEKGRAAAIVEVRELRESLCYDYGLSETDVAEIFKEEAKR